VLVDPVRAEACDDPLVPPRGGLQLLLPLDGGVPVVADVVVVEDHQARQRREQPPVGRVAPGELVEVGVLLVVLELVPRRLRDVAAGLDELLHLRAGLVGVDLVAEEEHEVGPPQVVLTPGHPERVGPHRVHAVGQVAGPVVGDAGAAGAVRHPQRLPRLHRRDDARRVGRGRLGPHRRTVDLHAVGVGGAGLEALDLDERVVVPVDREGGR